MMGQCADGDEVDARLSVFSEGLLGDSTGCLGLIFPIDAFYRFAESDGVEIVEHDAVDAAVIEDTLQLIEVADFNLNTEVFPFGFQVVVGTVDSSLDAACKVDVVVLEHHHIVEADTMVGATTAGNGVLLEESHIGGRLAGVEQLGVQTFEHGNHTVGLGSDAGEALHEVESGTLGGEDGTRGALDGHHYLTFEDSIAIVFQKIYNQIIIHYLKHSLTHFGATEDAILFGHHFGRSLSGRRDAGKGGVVAVADILAECHFD